MRTKHVNLYTYDELTPEAQSKARDWYRNADAGDNYFVESVTDDFKEVAAACGFDIGGRNPNNRHDDGIYWSGFSSQGDGASFSGSWRADDVDVAAILAARPAVASDRASCPIAAQLRAVLEGFASLAAEDTGAYGSATESHRGHWMACEYDTATEGLNDEPLARADTFKDLTRDLADWFYRALEAEYEYVNADEQVAETIRANGYEFTADGVRS